MLYVLEIFDESTSPTEHHHFQYSVSLEIICRGEEHCCNSDPADTGYKDVQQKPCCHTIPFPRCTPQIGISPSTQPYAVSVVEEPTVRSLHANWRSDMAVPRLSCTLDLSFLRASHLERCATPFEIQVAVLRTVVLGRSCCQSSTCYEKFSIRAQMLRSGDAKELTLRNLRKLQCNVTELESLLAESTLRVHHISEGKSQTTGIRWYRGLSDVEGHDSVENLWSWSDEHLHCLRLLDDLTSRANFLRQALTAIQTVTVTVFTRQAAPGFVCENLDGGPFGRYSLKMPVTGRDCPGALHNQVHQPASTCSAPEQGLRRPVGSQSKGFAIVPQKDC